MKITLNKKQWQAIGRQAGFVESNGMSDEDLDSFISELFGSLEEEEPSGSEIQETLDNERRQQFLMDQGIDDMTEAKEQYENQIK